MASLQDQIAASQQQASQAANQSVAPLTPQNLASLVNQNKTVNVGGQLSSETPIGVQALANAAGLQVPPTTGPGVAAIGGTAQQQAMAGTGQQLNAATNIALSPQNYLPTAQEQAKPAVKASEADQAASNKSRALAGLSNISQRVTDLIDAQRANLAAAAAAPVAGQLSVATANTLTLPTKTDYSTLKNELLSLEQNPNDMVTLAAVNQQLGRTASTPLSAQELQGLYGSTVDAIVSGAQGNVLKDITVSDLTKLPQFGYSPGQLANILGLKESDVSAMSIEQLREAISAQQAQPVAATQAAAQSTLGGVADRAAAAQQAQAQAQTGQAATEAQMTNLDSDIKKGEVVTFNGQQYTTEQLLGDQGISQTIRDYLNSAPGSAARTQLDANEAGLSNFINKHLDAFQSLTNSLGQGATNFADIQAKNLAVQQVGKVQISDDIMKTLIPNWGQPGQAIDPASIPLLKLTSSLPVAQGEALVNAINEIASTNPKLLAQIPSLTTDELQAIVDPAKYSELQANQQTLSSLANLQPNDINGALSLALGVKGVTADEVNSVLAQDAEKAALGLPTSGLAKYLPVDASGRVVNDVNAITAKVKAGTTAADLHELAANKVQTYAGPGELPVDPALANADQAALFSKLQPYITNGVLTGDDITKAGLTTHDLDTLESLGVLKNANADVQAAAGNITKTQQTNQTNSFLQSYPLINPSLIASGNTQSTIDSLNLNIQTLQKALPTLDASIYDINAVKARIAALQAQSASLADSLVPRMTAAQHLASGAPVKFTPGGAQIVTPGTPMSTLQNAIIVPDKPVVQPKIRPEQGFWWT